MTSETITVVVGATGDQPVIEVHEVEWSPGPSLPVEVEAAAAQTIANP